MYETRSKKFPVRVIPWKCILLIQNNNQYNLYIVYLLPFFQLSFGTTLFYNEQCDFILNKNFLEEKRLNISSARLYI